MSKRIVFIAFLFLFMASVKSYAAKTEESSLLSFLTDILDKVEMTSRVAQEFDSNVFLEEDGEDPDFKTSVYQGFSLQLPEDPFFIQLDYGLGYDYYCSEDEDLTTNEVKAVLSYRPFEKLSLGVSNNFKKVAKTSITTALGDRVISLGYGENHTVTEGKYDIDDETYLDSSFDVYKLDISDGARDDFIDRTGILTSLAVHRLFSPKIEGYFGYGYQDVRFSQTALKNSHYNRIYMGIVKKFPELLKLTAEVGLGNKDIDDQRDEDNADFSVMLDSLFSTYTKWSVLLDLFHLEPSSRQEYSQYYRSSVALQLEHYLTPKIMLIGSLGYELQRFEEEDSIAALFTNDRDTNIFTGGLTLRKILNDWLTVDGGYTYTKRNTDFAGEGYTDHKVIVGLTATY